MLIFIARHFVQILLTSILYILYYEIVDCESRFELVKSYCPPTFHIDKDRKDIQV